MAETTSIEWTEATWNPVTGCSVVSPGCTNCYAMRLAGTRLRHHPSRAGLTIDSKAGPVWTGEVRFNEGWLDQPLRWKRPRRIFVCAHGDLFHESVPDEWIARVFAVMCRAKRHTFQVLTKRAERMRDFLSRCANADELGWITHNGAAPKGYQGDGIIVGWARNWPLTNVWLGVSVEDQATADERIPDLIGCPAAVRFVSYEPALAGADFTRFVNPRDTGGAHSVLAERTIDWIIIGGESGPGARPFALEWARSAIAQCRAAGVPCFVKQLGARPVGDELGLRDRKGGDPSEWPEDLCVRQFPEREEVKES